MKLSKKKLRLKRLRERRDVTESDLVVKKKRKRKSPLKFLLSVMNDPDNPKMQRIKCALAALPYCHKAKNKIAKEKRPVGRPPHMVPEGTIPLVKQRRLGKKEVKQFEAQKAASSGRFRPLPPPHSPGTSGVTH